MIVTGTAAFAAGASGFSPDSGDAPSPSWTQPARGRRSAAPARLRPGRRAADGDDDVGDAGALRRVSGVAAAARGRKKRKRRRYGKLVLVLILLAGLVGAALMFGRDYLFPEDWAKDVAPAVDALQLSSGLEFTDPVVVNALPEAEYAAKVAGVMFGPAFGAELDDVGAPLAGPRPRRRRADASRR